MPSRSFFFVPDQLANKRVVLDHRSDLGPEYFDGFINRGIAPLVDEGSLAALMGLSTKTIFRIVAKRSQNYRTYYIAKSKSGKRRIDSPRTYLKVVQWWINDNILEHVSLDGYVSAFVRGRGPLYNAQIHVGSKHILNMDLKNFFPSVKRSKVFEVFSSLGYSSDVSGQLADLTTLNDSLPQGAPTSPYIANLAAASLDKRIQDFCLENSMIYSRYADDITVSSKFFITKKVEAVIANYVSEAGFSVNKSKTRYAGVGSRMEVTGLVINNTPKMPKYKRKEIRAAFHNASVEKVVTREEYSKLNGYLGALLSMGEEKDSPMVLKARAVLSALKASGSA